MKKLLAVGLLVLGACPAPPPAPQCPLPTGLPVFPGAVGYGTTTPGGRGGRVVEATTLGTYTAPRGEQAEEGPSTLSYISASAQFTAAGTTTSVKFASNDVESPYGIALDDVRVIPSLAAPAASDFTIAASAFAPALIAPGESATSTVSTTAIG
ncbi:MAG: hypothetical protein Q8L14_42245, partial [Myxococcales bacterium]|nr:hypothetical protein [Myxococcales bacterium]